MSKKTLPTRLQERIDVLMDVSRSYEEVMNDVASSPVGSPDFKTALQNSGITKPEQAEPLSVLPGVSPVKRVVPNVMLRGSLFGVVGKGNRKYEEDVLKATIGEISVRFTGRQLDQGDLDVYLECIRRCSHAPLGEQVRFYAYDFLKSIGRKTGKFEYDWLKACLKRLFNSGIEISDGCLFYDGHLINEKYRDEETKEFVISLNPKIADFFSTEQWTGLSLEERYALKGKPLAQWLHGFYSTHAKPHPYKVETIKTLCGSQRGELYKFRFDLKKSLTYVSAATGWQCWVENDLVYILKKK